MDELFGVSSGSSRRRIWPPQGSFALQNVVVVVVVVNYNKQPQL